MASEEQTIVFMTYFISVYLGYFIVIIGVIGNIINILVFTQLKLFRRNQSAFYLTVASIVDSFQLIFAMSTRITATVIGFDLTRTSLIWCKLRVYLIRSTRIISIITICFAAIDQYLSTNSHIQLRQLSTFKLAQRLIIGLLPIFISSLFSLLAYQNVRRIIRRQMSIVRRRLDRQLTAMILLRVALFVITTLPYISFRIYQINTSVNYHYTDSVGIIELINATLITIYNIDYSGSFFVFLISSSRFRRQVKYFFYRKIWRKFQLMRMKRNQVANENQLHIIEFNGQNPNAN
ncbi:unnamed protein product [Rotaria sp. Silwood1]|nr:unnamed protein product [Rotaria sp. Silwood1]